MKVRRHKKPVIPWKIGCLEKHGILRAHNVCLGKSRVAVKVLVFKTYCHYRAWFRDTCADPGSNSAAMVAYCNSIYQDFRGGVESKPVRMVEPRFYAVMGFVRGRIDLETISHECVHAAEAFMERFPGRKWPHVKTCPIEAICYPAGILTQYLFTTLAEFITPPKGWKKV